MTLSEAKKRPDYRFVSDGIDIYIDEIRHGKFKIHDEENGEHIWGCAVLEIGYVDIELNLESGTEDKSGKLINDVYPSYYVCVKYGDGPLDWDSVSIGYVDDKYPVQVDFCKADWEEQLERDMFEKLMYVVKDYGLHIDEPNNLD